MIDPKCLNGKNCFGFSAKGYLLPCCWADNYIRMKYFSELVQEKFHLSNVDSIDEIVNSQEWQDFYRGLIDNPEEAPQVCKDFCAANFDNKLYEDS